MATVIIKIRELKSPYMETPRGYRCLVATPNMAGSAFGRAIASFDKPYLICMYGDYETWEAFIKLWPAVKADLLRQQFDKWSFVGDEA